MFTGIVQNTGKMLQKGRKVVIEAGRLAQKLKLGSSVAVDGACLTVTGKTGNSFFVDVMPETLKKTNLKIRKPGDLLNLELPLLATGCFEGHIVTGHVEGVGKITKIQKRGNSYWVTLKIPRELTRYVVPKGSIALNGVSLTVIDIQKTLVTVGLIPYTWKHTNFHALKVGDKVNVETDVMAKYFEQWQK